MQGRDRKGYGGTRRGRKGQEQMVKNGKG